MKFPNFSQRASELADVFVLDDADPLLGQVVAMVTELHHKARVVATLRVVHEATVVLLQVLGTKKIYRKIPFIIHVLTKGKYYNRNTPKPQYFHIDTSDG